MGVEEGFQDGCCVGYLVGSDDGLSVGSGEIEGFEVDGCDDGTSVGSEEGLEEGIADATFVGIVECANVGCSDSDGCGVGGFVGPGEGIFEG